MYSRQRAPLNSSFRDPGGFVFKDNGKFYRQINKSALKDFNIFNKSELKNKLEERGLILRYKEIPTKEETLDNCRLIEPQQLPFITYPYEWCFSQLKESAILTLEIVLESLEYGMILKDASPFNIQMTPQGLRHIDTLSFSTYREGRPWVAYKQYCETFLTPLLMMAYVDKSLNKLLITNLGGIPLELTSNILPWKNKLNTGYLVHISAHNKLQKLGEEKLGTPKNLERISKESLIRFIRNLQSYTKNIKTRDNESFWESYYGNNNYTEESMKRKATIVGKWIKEIKPKSIWDLGTNTGKFAELGAASAEIVVAVDTDHQSIERLYKRREHSNIHPLIVDMTNPSPSIGWENNERASFINRGPTDLILSLALIHHLAISNNTPLEKIAKIHESLTKNVIIEFIPKEDTQVQRLLETREDIFESYTQEHFENAFKEYFSIEEKYKIPDTQRTLYKMQKK